jgi:hypothetical protein
MPKASGADIADHIRSAHLPSSIDPAMVSSRHVFPRSSLMPAKQLLASRASAPVVIAIARTGPDPEEFSCVIAAGPALRLIAAAGLCHLNVCAFVIRGFKTK